MIRYILIPLLLLGSLLFVTSCEEEEETAPKVETLEVIGISGSSVSAKGSVVNKGSLEILDYGFVYSLGNWSGGELSVERGTKISLGKEAVEGSFTKEFSMSFTQGGYTNSVQVRSYLTNKRGTVYGKAVNATLPQVIFGGVSPSVGEVGEKIKIAGNNLSNREEDYEVKFNDVIAKISEVSTTGIIVEIPSNINYTYYYNQIRITVRFGGSTYTVADYFKLKPSVVDFSPKSGSFGSIITITGQNFNYQTFAIRLGSQTYGPGTLNNNTMTITVPNDLTSKKFKITVLYDNASIELPGEFEMLPPVIDSFTPSTSLPGNSVTVYGTHFNPGSYYNYNNTVKVGNEIAQISSSTSTSVTFRVPSTLIPGDYPIFVNTGLFTATATSTLKVVGPTISDFSPKTGAVGSVITITGSNLRSDEYNTSVLFGSVSAYLQESSPNVLKVTVPSNISAGAMKLTVNAGNLSTESKDNFIIKAPSITSFIPSSAVPGSQVEITGQGFSPVKSYNHVTFGTTPAAVIDATNTYLRIQVPSNAGTGKMKISVTVDGMVGTSTQDFTINL